MDILIKIVLVLSFVALLAIGLSKLDSRIAEIEAPGLRLLAQSFLYALLFTPTVYHYAPNTIVAPFHLPTVCGNLFYRHEYSLPMFMYGVVFPVLCGWVILAVVMFVRHRDQLTASEG